ncbi:hypothetical protein ACHAQJ_003527 [Trichoderma viride]
MASPLGNFSKDLNASINQVSTNLQKNRTSKKPKEPVADSWEDEDVSDGAAEEEEEEEEEDQGKDVDAGISTPSSLATPAVPPPTPASPLGYDSPHEWASLASDSQSQSPVATSASGSGSGTPAKRPEKTDAVARRMIAAGLGLKAPKQTDEQRAYQRSIREQEKKKKEMDKAEEERKRQLTEKAKASVWED